MKKRTKILALFLTAGWIFCALCGFTCVPPEDWEAKDPKFCLPAPDTQTSGATFSGQIMIIDPTADSQAVIPVPILPAQTDGPVIVLLDGPGQTAVLYP